MTTQPEIVNTVRLDPVSPSEFIRAIDSFLDCGQSHVVHFLAAHPMTLARRDPEYRHVLNSGDMNLPDGMAVVWALRSQGRTADRLAGTEGMRLTADWGRGRHVRHYLFGSTPDVLARLETQLQADFPGITIVGTESPPFSPLTSDDLAASAEQMRASGTDVVWIGLGAPKQDVVADQLRRMDAAPVILCVGAAFDFASGVKKRAPLWMRHAGIEWLHRLASEPGRLWKRYLIGNSVFMLGVLSDRLRKVLGLAPPPARRLKVSGITRERSDR